MAYVSFRITISLVMGSNFGSFTMWKPSCRFDSGCFLSREWMVFLHRTPGRCHIWCSPRSVLIFSGCYGTYWIAFDGMAMGVGAAVGFLKRLINILAYSFEGQATELKLDTLYKNCQLKSPYIQVLRGAWKLLKLCSTVGNKVTAPAGCGPGQTGTITLCQTAPQNVNHFCAPPSKRKHAIRPECPYNLHRTGIICMGIPAA